MVLSKDQILAADDRKYAVVEVPEWGGAVRIASMNAATRLEVLDLVERRKTAGEDRSGMAFVTTILVRTIVDDGGALVFTDEDVPRLMQKSLTALNLLLPAALEINGFAEDKLEEQRKNSSSDLNDGSPFGSPSLSVA